MSITGSSCVCQYETQCGEWVFDLVRLLSAGQRSLRAEGHTASDSVRLWALLHTQEHTSTHTVYFSNWQWKGFQGKHLIVLLFSVFKLSLPTLMLTVIELCNGGGWHVIFKSKAKKVFEQSASLIVFQLARQTTGVIVILYNTLVIP